MFLIYPIKIFKRSSFSCAVSLRKLTPMQDTEYALEQIYNIIDSRYHSRKPLIVTTNLTLDEIRYPQDTAHARIYDRLLEMCVPVVSAVYDVVDLFQCVLGATLHAEIVNNKQGIAAILNELNRSFSGRNEVVDKLCRYPLLIIDDFGMERGTEYALEQIYNIILSTTSFRPEKLRFNSFRIRAKFVIRTGTSCSIRAFAMHPARKLLPVPTPPQRRSPRFSVRMVCHCST